MTLHKVMRFVGRIGQTPEFRLPPDAPERPDRVVLGVRAGHAPSPKPPVRVFLGTERAQYRAERTFVWSIEKVRDPARVYEIHLMRDLRGFDRRRWLTGFTGYRFAIPAFAGGQGRAIYNDVDQIYLTDPAELFDTELGEHAFLALPPRGSKGMDTSVMLLDCARMSSIWTLEDARHQAKKVLLERATARPDLMGPLDPTWNARDDEYREGRSRLIHYTILHTQPWMPFPEQYAYQHNPVGRVWHELEREADVAGFQLFGPDRPSGRLQARLGPAAPAAPGVPGAPEVTGAAPRELPPAAAARLRELFTEAEVRTLVVYGPEAGDVARKLCGPSVTQHLPRAATPGELTPPAGDALLAMDGLDWVPGEDVPWVLDALFASARRCVAIVAPAAVARSRPRPAEWWAERLGAAARRNPGVHWELLESSASGRGGRLEVRRGGRPPHAGPPVVWVLSDGRPGHTAQSTALADALGWEYETKRLHFRRTASLHLLHDRLVGATLATIDRGRSDRLEAPWPDLVVAAGRRTAPVARWIAEQSEGRTRLVQLGRKGGHVADPFDLVVTPEHCRYPPHPKRIETRLPINPISSAGLAQAHERFRGLFDGAPRPHVALLIGGAIGRYRFDEATARRLAEESLAVVRAVGGSLFAITSRRTGARAAAALEAALGDGASLHRWRPDEEANPYEAYLALADAIIVSGESESMLADAIATGKPVYLFPLPGGAPSVKSRLQRWVYDRSQERPLNKRGTVRPQRGLERLCARLVERGFVEPPRSLELMHESLLRDGSVRRLGEPLTLTPAAPPTREVDLVASRVRDLLGLESGRPRPEESRAREMEHAR